MKGERVVEVGEVEYSGRKERERKQEGSSLLIGPLVFSERARLVLRRASR